MKLRTAAVWAVVGMMASSAAAMSVPMKPAPQAEIAPALGPAVTTTSSSASTSATTKGPQPRFHADQGLTLDARLGHAALPQGKDGETFLLASIAGDGVSEDSGPSQSTTVPSE